MLFLILNRVELDPYIHKDELMVPIMNHFIEEDVHLFLLDESPLGEYNKKHLEFIYCNFKYG